MPTYQYRCEECGKAFERTETISEHEKAKPWESIRHHLMFTSAKECRM
jgi:predicted nucleic acid-binding Zn ribbon protein